MTKWTPGPWQHEKNSNVSNSVSGQSGQNLFEGDNGFRTIALVQSCNQKPAGTQENLQANINLIAAAPELYEALKSLLECADHSLQGRYRPDRAMIHANAEQVLAKARGEQ